MAVAVGLMGAPAPTLAAVIPTPAVTPAVPVIRRAPALAPAWHRSRAR